MFSFVDKNSRQEGFTSWSEFGTTGIATKIRIVEKQIFENFKKMFLGKGLLGGIRRGPGCKKSEPLFLSILAKNRSTATFSARTNRETRSSKATENNLSRKSSANCKFKSKSGQGENAIKKRDNISVVRTNAVRVAR